MSFYEDYLKVAAKLYPKTAAQLNLPERISANLICPTTLELPTRLLNQAREIVRAFFKLRCEPSRLQALAKLNPDLPNPGHYSALMSYDFHLDSHGQLKLIEINTNASMSLMVDISANVKQLPYDYTPAPDFGSEIMGTFQSEFSLFQGAHGTDQPLPTRSLSNTVICDHQPLSQRLYIEFEFFRELFQSSGLMSELTDPSELRFQNGQLTLRDKQIDLVYNRSTDFYFESESSRDLRAANLSHAACITPNPFEYLMLADKERLEELSQQMSAPEPAHLALKHSPALENALIKCMSVAEVSDKDALWHDRKKWFFKPKRSFGGKAVYRGSSMSRGSYATVVAGDYLAQELVPPGVVFIKPGSERAALPGAGEHLPAGYDEFKYDLRFFVYQDVIQLSCARVYKGQVTNSQTLGGGVAPIVWV